MPRTSGGTYQQPTGTAAVSSTAISSSEYNTLISDLGTEITNSLDRYGRAAMLAALQMGGFKITGMANGSASSDGATVGNVSALIPSGTAMLFAQSAAPTGWTQVTTANDAALRIVSGATGGTLTAGAYTLSAWQSGYTQPHTLTAAEMPYHTHADGGHTHTRLGHTTYGITPGTVYINIVDTGSVSDPGFAAPAYAGSGGAHSHQNYSFSYYDVIVATKN
jgi:hypothetical protein